MHYNVAASILEVHFSRDSGVLPDLFVQRDNLTVTVGQDRFEALVQRLGALEVGVADNSEAITQNTEDIVDNTEAHTEEPTFPGEPSARRSAVSTETIGDMSAQADYREATTATTQTFEQVGETIPTAYALDVNYPNPFNAATTIRFDVPQADHVTLQVYDAQGRAVATLVDGHRSAGKHQVAWEASRFASGTYLLSAHGRPVRRDEEHDLAQVTLAIPR